MRGLKLFVILLAGFVSLGASAAEDACPRRLADGEIPGHFDRLARLQLQLEYGAARFEIDKVEVHAVDAALARVEARIQVSRAEAGSAATFWVRGWFNRCEGTLILRGNAWLADGTLVAPRYTKAQLPGQGIVFGDDKAPLRVIAFVDSRCPHCHRLIGYARELLKKGALQIEVRQVAYLETAVEAVKDTRIHETALIHSGLGALGAEAYLDMLSEFNNTLDVDTSAPAYERGLALIQTNTQTARDVLHVTTVPTVLVLDRPQSGEYRLTTLAELNRLFQPDL
jgi:hypothetical protein